MIEGDEVHVVKIVLPPEADIVNYDMFTVQCVPPTGATITLKRTLPGTLSKVMDLN
jgi:archaellin